MELKSLQSLVGMMADTVRGSAEARDALAALLTRAGDVDALRTWVQRFVPMGGNLLRPELLAQQIEEVARMTGFVPRSKYLELLERHEILREKLADAEKTIQRLQAMLATGGNEPAARKLLDGLGTAVGGTLKVQADIMRSISGLFAAEGEKKGKAAAKPKPKSGKKSGSGD